MSKNILIIGPFPLPTTGVSLANEVVAKHLEYSTEYNVVTLNTSFSSFDEKLGTFSFKKLWFYLKLNLSVYKLFKAQIVYVTPGQTFFGVLKYSIFIIIASLLKTPIVQHIHGNYLGRQYELLTGLKRKIFHFLMSRTTIGIVLSSSLESNFTPFIPVNDIYVLNNFVIEPLFFDDKILENKNYEGLNIVYLSNLMVEKGILDLLDALEIIEKNNIKYSAKIAGNIASENRAIIQLKLSRLKHTDYVGVVNEEQKVNLLKWSNIFVLPTYYTMEGQPISILEAMATGNLVLTTAHAGIPDIFEDGKNGFFVEKQNPQYIAAKLIEIKNNQPLIKEIAYFNYHKARAEYNVSTFITCLKEILSNS